MKSNETAPAPRPDRPKIKRIAPRPKPKLLGLWAFVYHHPRLYVCLGFALGAGVIGAYAAGLIGRALFIAGLALTAVVLFLFLIGLYSYIEYVMSRPFDERAALWGDE